MPSSWACTSGRTRSGHAGRSSCGPICSPAGVSAVHSVPPMAPGPPDCSDRPKAWVRPVPTGPATLMARAPGDGSGGRMTDRRTADPARHAPAPKGGHEPRARTPPRRRRGRQRFRPGSTTLRVMLGARIGCRILCAKMPSRAGRDGDCSRYGSGSSPVPLAGSAGRCCGLASVTGHRARRPGFPQRARGLTYGAAATRSRAGRRYGDLHGL